MFVNWIPKRVLILNHSQAGSPIAGLSAPGATISKEQMKAKLKAARPITLSPGINMGIDEAAFEACIKGNDEVLALIDSRELVVLTKGMFGLAKDAKDSADPVEDIPKTLAGVKDFRDAIALVEGYTIGEFKPLDNVGLLESWLAAEEGGKGRDTLIKAIQAQITKLSTEQANFAKAGVRQRALAA